jgi:Bacterial regulatory protein, arsR family
METVVTSKLMDDDEGGCGHDRSTVVTGAPYEGLPRQVAGLARALGHPARIRIVRTLIDQQACIGCDLVDEIGLAQSTVSEHLRILKAAGIITGDTGPVTPVRGHTRPRTLDYAA